MPTLLILRRDAAAARLTQGSLETTRDMRIIGVVSTLEAARQQLARVVPDVMICDLSLNDGAAMSLLAEMRRGPATRERPKVMLIAPTATDVLLFGSISAGADSYIVEALNGPSLPSALRRMVQGEAAINPALALQVLDFFGVSSRVNAQINERMIDWQLGASDPLTLSRGEQHLLALLAQGEPISSAAMRLALSIESAGRRISNIYRKLQWDLRSGALALHAS